MESEGATAAAAAAATSAGNERENDDDDDEEEEEIDDDEAMSGYTDSSSYSVSSADDFSPTLPKRRLPSSSYPGPPPPLLTSASGPFVHPRDVAGRSPPFPSGFPAPPTGFPGGVAAARATFPPPPFSSSAQPRPPFETPFQATHQSSFHPPNSSFPAPCAARFTSRIVDVTDQDSEMVEEKWSDSEEEEGSSSGKDSRALSLISSEPEIRVCDSEMATIQNISLLHDQRYKSIGFGEELIKEMVMCSVFGIPLSTSASILAYRLMIQRITKVAHHFENFLDMTHPVQVALLRQNADLIVSLRGAVFFDEQKHGLDQVRGDYTRGVSFLNGVL